MKILIIGGSRFIGLATTLALHRQGHELALFNRGKSPTELPSDIHTLMGDINDLAASREALLAFKPDVIWHNIVLHDGHVRDVQAIFAGSGARFVMTSSVDVYLTFGRILGRDPGEVLGDEIDEDSPLRGSRYPYRSAETPPHDIMYRYDKIPAEQAALAHPELPGCVVRLPMVVGERDPRRRLLPFVQPMRLSRPAIILDAAYARWISTYGYVENIAHALTLAITDPRANGRIYNACDASLSTLEMGEQVRTAMGWGGEFVVLPGDELPEALRFFGGNAAQNLRVRAQRIRDELGYMPQVDRVEAIRRTVAWELANPPAELPPELTDFSAEDEVLAKLKK